MVDIRRIFDIAGVLQYTKSSYSAKSTISNLSGTSYLNAGKRTVALENQASQKIAITPIDLLV